jgi:RHS repeat-associated protein
MLYPNGIATAYEYDTESRLERITAKLGTTVITDFQYTYNAVGNRTEKQTPDLAETYRYDRADQLGEVARTGTGANRWHYAYDPAGNRTTEQVGNAPVQASFDNMNRLLSTSAGGALTFKGSLDEPATVTIDGQPAEVDGTDAFQGTVNSTSGTNTVVVEATDPSSNTRTNTYEVEVSGTGTTYEYDANGNLIEKDDGTDTWTYDWNADNRLIEVSENETTVATFEYDPLGRRVEKVVGATTTTFAYDWADILRETAGGTTTYNVHGPGIDEPLAKEISGTTTYYHADGLGSILKLSDGVGDVAHEYRYDPYGRIESGSSQGGYSFTGREWEPELGLYYYRARYYDPEVSRFINEDPLWFGGGPNFYLYAKNNAITYADPFGLEVINNSGGRIWVKEEGSGSTHPVDPGATYSEPHDGLAVPDHRPGEVFKTGNGIDATVNSDGTVDTSGGNPIEKAYQWWEGGWKDKSWNDELHEDGDTGWDELFERSRPPKDGGGCP